MGASKAGDVLDQTARIMLFLAPYPMPLLGLFQLPWQGVAEVVAERKVLWSLC